MREIESVSARACMWEGVDVHVCVRARVCVWEREREGEKERDSKRDLLTTQTSQESKCLIENDDEGFSTKVFFYFEPNFV